MVDEVADEIPENDDIEKSRMPLVDHLRELRKRLLWSGIAFVILFFVCF